VSVNHVDVGHDHRKVMLAMEDVGISDIAGPHHFIIMMSGQYVVHGFNDWPNSGTVYETMTHLGTESLCSSVARLKFKTS